MLEIEVCLTFSQLKVLVGHMIASNHIRGYKNRVNYSRLVDQYLTLQCDTEWISWVQNSLRYNKIKSTFRNLVSGAWFSV
jgi:hypothetical protein